MDNVEIMSVAARMISYDPETGAMTWKPKGAGTKDYARWNSRHAGQACGSIDKDGYRTLFLKVGPSDIKNILLHRLAWFIAHGTLPKNHIDHINHDRADNRLSNLRDVSQSINQRNRVGSKNNKSGVSGVTWHERHRKWLAQVSVNGRRYYLGCFSDIAIAEIVVNKFRAENGFTATHGRALIEQEARHTA